MTNNKIQININDQIKKRVNAFFLHLLFDACILVHGIFK